MPFKNLADFKRRLQPGVKLSIVNHLRPEMTRVATVLTATTASFSVTLPDAHPNKADYPDGSFMAWPKAAHFTAETGEMYVLKQRGNDLEAVLTCTYEILP